MASVYTVEDIVDVNINLADRPVDRTNFSTPLVLVADAPFSPDRIITVTDIDNQTTFELDILNPLSNSQDYTIESFAGMSFYSPEHQHVPNPGIDEFTGKTPSNVDVLVDGTTVATDIGSGTFETIVDISNELTVGAWNDIALSSDSLGHIQATVSVDGYKQIGTQ